MLSICIDGPNGVGKSAAVHRIAGRLRSLHLRVAILTDTAVAQEVKTSPHPGRAPFPQTRAALRQRLLGLQPDVYLQERGLISHLVFEHLAPDRTGEAQLGACCADDCEPFFMSLVLTAPMATIERRLRKRGAGSLALPLEEQIGLFETAVRIAGWPIYVNDGPCSLGRLVRSIVGTLMAERTILVR